MELKEAIEEYASGGYPVSRMGARRCTCGADRFTLYSDEVEGGACLYCAACGAEQYIRDSSEFMKSAIQHVCTCDVEVFEVAVGLALYADSHDVRWVYVGGRCTECGLAGVYADWQER